MIKLLGFFKNKLSFWFFFRRLYQCILLWKKSFNLIIFKCSLQILCVKLDFELEVWITRHREVVLFLTRGLWAIFLTWETVPNFKQAWARYFKVGLIFKGAKILEQNQNLQSWALWFWTFYIQCIRYWRANKQKIF